MAKVTITLFDKPDGNLGLIVDPDPPLKPGAQPGEWTPAQTTAITFLAGLQLTYEGGAVQPPGGSKAIAAAQESHARRAEETKRRHKALDKEMADGE